MVKRLVLLVVLRHEAVVLERSSYERKSAFFVLITDRVTRWS